MINKTCKNHKLVLVTQLISAITPANGEKSYQVFVKFWFGLQKHIITAV